MVPQGWGLPQPRSRVPLRAPPTQLPPQHRLTTPPSTTVLRRTNSGVSANSSPCGTHVRRHRRPATRIGGQQRPAPLLRTKPLTAAHPPAVEQAEHVLERWRAAGEERRMQAGSEVVVLRVPSQYPTVQAALRVAMSLPRHFQLLVSSGTFYPYGDQIDEESGEQSHKLLITRNIEICAVGGAVRLVGCSICLNSPVKVVLRDIHLTECAGLAVEHGLLQLQNCAISLAPAAVVMARGMRSRLDLTSCALRAGLGIQIHSGAQMACKHCKFQVFSGGISVADERSMLRLAECSVGSCSGETAVKVARGAAAELERVQLMNNTQAAVHAMGCGSTLLMRQCVVRGQHGPVNPANGISTAAAIKVSDGVAAQLCESVVEHNHCLALCAYGMGTKLAVSDSVVRSNQKGLLSFGRAVVHLQGSKFEANVEGQVEIVG